jgi:hypothetical protein
MKSELLYEDEYLQVLWDARTRIMSIDWKEATSKMVDEDFKAELTLFAKKIEEKEAPRILIDVSKFRYRPGEEVGEWRRKNISTRYNAAGVKRFAFLFSNNSQIPPMESGPAEGELFLTQSFNSYEQATSWLTASD